MKIQSFTCSSDLPVEVDEVLATLTIAGVNKELRPLARMTAPSLWRHRPIFDWPEQQALFKSWILLLGILPIDRHSFYMESIKPGEGFIESSSSAMNACWRHERMITPVQSGCRVTDYVTFECRLPLFGEVLKPVYRRVFLRRHQTLRSRYV